ncbi:hypothetical protein TrLO_g15671 [Triparma laevis f. longispina]|uniref:Uncharacterized protein n=1 Tax=Triparma laevis f. longispina TaxID=1714387 RepID=A0A9W7FUX6_9STRA|nr:hypothetical protein TrLO_g15671 [Triparma laevis f. longispina]
MNFNLQHSELIQFLNNSPSMRKTAGGSIKAGLYAGSGAVGGGVIFGPVGAMFGGIIGSIVGYIRGDEYDGAVKAAQALPPAQQEALVKEVSEILVSAGAASQMLMAQGGLLTALEEFAKQPAVRDQVWQAVVTGATLND